MNDPVDQQVRNQPLGVEYRIRESVPQEKTGTGVFWKQGEFYLQDQKRTATLTDVKFLAPDILVVAHRAAAKLYLIRLLESSIEILDSIVLDTSKRSLNPLRRFINGRYFHPDLMALTGSTVFMSEYTYRCCAVKVVNNRFVYRRTFKVGEANFHGCYATGGQVMLGSVNTGQVALYDTLTNTVDTLDAGLKKGQRIKTIWSDADHLVLGVDKKSGSTAQPGTTVDTWINLYRREGSTLVLIDSLSIPSSQIDGHKHYEGRHFFTTHSGKDKCGNIVVVEVSDDSLAVVKVFPCRDFPHGIDILNDQLVYTAYANSAIVLHPLQDVLGVAARSRCQ